MSNVAFAGPFNPNAIRLWYAIQSGGLYSLLPEDNGNDSAEMAHIREVFGCI